MRMPLRMHRTPFRLTVLFLSLYAFVAAALLAFIYIATVADARDRASHDVRKELALLEGHYKENGLEGLNRTLVGLTANGGPYLLILSDAKGQVLTQNIAESPVETFEAPITWTRFRVTDMGPNGEPERVSALGAEVRLSGGERLFVGIDMGDADAHLALVVRALWGAAILVILLGLAGGFVIGRSVEKAMAGLTGVVSRVAAGEIGVRAQVRGAGDEYDELASGLNSMLDRLETSMANLRYAGDAIAHDLRTPLNRMRSRLELALIDLEHGRGDAEAALETALNEADNLLHTFNTVLAISRLQAASSPPDPRLFDAADLAADLAELFTPAAEDKGLEFTADVSAGLPVMGNREFLAQALSNLIDNAIKYTPSGGAIRLATRRCSNGEIEFSVTDTGPGVPEADRPRVIQRFVRLENSRSAPGVGLGLSLVAAVAEVHQGRLDLSEGPGAWGEYGPGLRVALLLPPPTVQAG
ncbi:MAG: sensor histidine kinase [Asticcacaulis sp.]